ncbi:hypothetical protein CR513_53571, partial [Mucuna pruriens]
MSICVINTSQHQNNRLVPINLPQNNKVANGEIANREWMTLIWEYLKNRSLAEDKSEATKIRIRVIRYLIEAKMLYKRGFFVPLLKCLTKSQARRKNDDVSGVERRILLANNETRRLGRVKALWAEQFPNIIWAYHYTPQTSTGETSFRLAFGIDTMIPVEIGEPSIRRSRYNPKDNEITIRVDLDLVEETKEQKCIKQEACKQRVTRRYNSKVKPRVLWKTIWYGGK